MKLPAFIGVLRQLATGSAAAPVALAGAPNASPWDDVDRALHEQEPLRARFLLKCFWLVLVVALLWAGFTRVDEITRGEGRVVPGGRNKPGRLVQVVPQHRQGVQAPKQFAVNAQGGHTKNAAVNGLLRAGFEPLFQGGIVEAKCRLQLRHELRKARQVACVQAGLPDMPEDALTDKAVGRAAIDPKRRSGEGQPQQRQGVEGVGFGHQERRAVPFCQPHHLAVGPLAFAGNLGGAQLPMVFQQPGKQHRLIGHAVTMALQRLRQLLKGEVCVGRDEVKIKSDVFHRQTEGGFNFDRDREPAFAARRRLPCAGQCAPRPVASPCCPWLTRRRFRRSCVGNRRKNHSPGSWRRRRCRAKERRAAGRAW